MILVAGGFLLLGWQGITTAGRSFPTDSREYVLNAQYLREHRALPPDYVSYEYSAPPLYEALAIGADRLAESLPSVGIESRSNVLERLLWLVLVIGSAVCLTGRGRRTHRLGIALGAAAALWGLDEAVSLAKTQMWSAGQMVSLGAALGLVTAAGLIAREVWPHHPRRWLATAAFVVAYPVVLRLGVLFHPETLAAFLGAVAVLVTMRAMRHGWALGPGLAAGAVCGLGLLTRQSAFVVLVCLVIAAVVYGGARARRFTLAMVTAAALVAGPWLGYAASEWGNPLQGNLQQPGSMLAHGESRSFYVSFPLPTLVTDPVAHRLDNQFLPQLHADLWSDYFGGFLSPGRERTAVSHAAASTQSALGLAADALAIGGLVALGIPSLINGIRRRTCQPTEAGYGLLALLALAGLVGLVAQVIRYPQALGLEIKASYLLFTAPSWALFSVATWVTLARRSARIRTALAFGAGLYVLSYGTALAAAFVQPFDQQLRVVEPEQYVDLSVSIQDTTAMRVAAVGSEQDFTIWVANKGTASSNPVLTIGLDSGLRLLGSPYIERGPGCAGGTTLVCPLEFLAAGATTPVRFGLRLTRSGNQTLSAQVGTAEKDATPADNRASYVFISP